MIGRTSSKSARARTAPDQAALRYLLQEARKTATSAQVSWPSSTPELLYTLHVTCSAVKERRGWEKGSSGDMVAPEWTLYQIRENHKDRVDLWRMATGDFAIIENLLEESLNSREPAARQSGSFPLPEAPVESQTSSQQINVSQITPAPEQTSQPQAGAGVNLSGNLKEVDLASILQSISLCKMTGRLNVYDAMHQAEIFFRDGELIHALSSRLMDTTNDTRGETVVLEVFTWEDGTFQFQHGWQTAERTVQKRLQNLVLEGATLRDYKGFLDKAGVEPESILLQSETNITEEQFDTRLATGLPLHVDFQKRVFLVLREPRSLTEILDAVPMDRSTWMPVIFSLLNSRLIMTRTSFGETDQCAQAFENIRELISSAEKGLLQPDSGMISYPMFLSFAEKEFERRVPFCIAMFEFNLPGASITNEALKSVGACFESIKKPYDAITFWQPNRLLMMLPHSLRADAMPRINAFLDKVAKEIASDNLSLVCGLASAPSDGVQLADVLASSYRLIKTAQQTKVRVMANSTTS